MRRFGIAGGGGVDSLARVYVDVPDDPEDADDTESEVPVCIPSSVVVVSEHGTLPSDEAFDFLRLLKTFLNSSWSKVSLDSRGCSAVGVRSVEDIF